MRIGIDMGGTTVKIGLVNATNEIIDRMVTPTRSDVLPEEMIGNMIEAVRMLLK